MIARTSDSTALPSLPEQLQEAKIYIRTHVCLQARLALSAASRRVSTLHPYNTRQHTKMTQGNTIKFQEPGSPNMMQVHNSQQALEPREGLNHLHPLPDWATP